MREGGRRGRLEEHSLGEVGMSAGSERAGSAERRCGGWDAGGGAKAAGGGQDSLCTAALVCSWKTRHALACHPVHLCSCR